MYGWAADGLLNVPCCRGNASDVDDNYELSFVQNLQTTLVLYLNPIGCDTLLHAELQLMNETSSKLILFINSKASVVGNYSNDQLACINKYLDAAVDRCIWVLPVCIIRGLARYLGIEHQYNINLGLRL
jgi:hypothetical protein